jgi:carboxylesterase
MADSVLQHPELEGSSFFWEAGPVGILLFHGLTATTAEVRPLAAYLYRQGFTVAAPLLPGHGTTPQELNRQTWQSWVTAGEGVCQSLLKKCQKVIVGGESMGGLLALLLARSHPELKGILLYAPALHIPGVERARLIAPFRPFILKKAGYSTLPWQGYFVNPTYAVVQLEKLQNEVRRQLPEIKQPVFIAQGCQDLTIDLQSAKLVYDGIGSGEKDLHYFQESGHIILLDKEFDTVAELTLNFIRKNTAD